MGRSILATIVLLIWTSNVSAQIKTRLRIGNSDGSELHYKIEDNISAFLTECNAAASGKRDLCWMGIVITSNGKDRISTLWKGKHLPT